MPSYTAAAPSGIRPFAEIARGPVAVVYRALDEASGEVVLLKALRPGADAERRARFAEEVRLASGVTHPNVVRVLRASEDALVAEWVDGETLGQLVSARGPLPAPLAAFVAHEVAAGLRAIHRAGIVHRDLSPANVLVGDDGRVRVTDFGLASLAPEASGADGGEVRGTLASLAPEVVRGTAPTPEADVFALGTLLVLALTGRAPFEGTDSGDTLDRVLHTDPLPALRSDPRVPEPLAEAAASLLAKDPGERAADPVVVLMAAAGAVGRADAASLAAWIEAPASWSPPTPEAPAGLSTPSTTPPSASRGRRALAGLAILASGLVLLWAVWPPETPPPFEPVAEPLASAPVPISPSDRPEVDALLPPEASGERETPKRGAVPAAPSREAPPQPERLASGDPPRDRPAPAAPEAGESQSRATPASGTLRISVEPWAHIRVDGRAVGTTPLAPLALAAGPHEVTFENPDFPSHTVRVDVAPETEAIAAVSLWTLVGRFTLDVRPWARVSVDGAYWDTVPPQARPLVLAPGAHVVRFEHDALGTREVRLDVAAGEQRTLRVRFDGS